MISRIFFLLSSILLLVHGNVLTRLQVAELAVQRGAELERISQGFNSYNWSTSVPDSLPNVVVNGVEMPPKVLVMSHEGSAARVWPAGTSLTWDQWFAMTGENYSTSDLNKRQDDPGNEWGPDCGRDPCLPSCTQDEVLAHQEGYYQTFGYFHKMTGEVCGSGSSGRTYTTSYSWSLSVNAGPDLPGALLGKFSKIITKIGIQVGGSYTWGAAQSTSYIMDFPALTRGTVWYRPFVGVAHCPATVAKVWSNRGGVHICSVHSVSKYDVHIPMLACDGCGGDGIWGACFFEETRPCGFTSGGHVPPGGKICPIWFGT